MAKRGKVTFENKQADLSRPVRVKKYQHLFLIVCEDQTTEPAYFRQFKPQIPDGTLYLREVGTGLSPLGVVKRAIEERDKLSEEGGRTVDTVWAVFDKDDNDQNETTKNSFREAYALAAAENIKIALSNEVFELWFLLHFRDIDPTVPLSRQQVYETLQQEIRTAKGDPGYLYGHYRKAAEVVPLVIQLGGLDAAILRAQALKEYFKDRDPIEANPSTDVFLLVGELMQLIEFYSYTI